MTLLMLHFRPTAEKEFPFLPLEHVLREDTMIAGVLPLYLILITLISIDILTSTDTFTNTSTLTGTDTLTNTNTLTSADPQVKSNLITLGETVILPEKREAAMADKDNYVENNE